MSASLKAKIIEVFEEPGCDKNQAKSERERKKGCTKQLTPGAAAGGFLLEPLWSCWISPVSDWGLDCSGSP